MTLLSRLSFFKDKFFKKKPVYGVSFDPSIKVEHILEDLAPEYLGFHRSKRGYAILEVIAVSEGTHAKGLILYANGDISHEVTVSLEILDEFFKRDAD